MEESRVLLKFSGLKVGKHQFQYKIEQSFFDLFEFDQDFSSPKLEVLVELEKKENFMVASIGLSGEVLLDCDVCLESLSHKLNEDLNLIIRFAEEFDDSEEEILLLPFNAYQVDLSQYIYELTLLNLPLKRVHSSCKDKWEDLPQIQPIEQQKDSKDPRWEKLNDLYK
ncbi:MAG: hypothetical protein C4K58_07865 [Flavobacteriaceae bacterium]|nr:MAG: hypothetical protein C4K58_07865 [Flavobacteriaceae bacterium]